MGRRKFRKTKENNVNRGSMKTLEISVLNCWGFNSWMNVIKRVLCSWQMARGDIMECSGFICIYVSQIM